MKLRQRELACLRTELFGTILHVFSLGLAIMPRITLYVTINVKSLFNNVLFLVTSSDRKYLIFLFVSYFAYVIILSVE